MIGLKKQPLHRSLRCTQSDWSKIFSYLISQTLSIEQFDWLIKIADRSKRSKQFDWLFMINVFFPNIHRLSSKDPLLNWDYCTGWTLA